MLIGGAPRGAGDKLDRHQFQPPVIMLKDCYAVPCPLCTRILASNLEHLLLLTMLFDVKTLVHSSGL